MIKLLVNAGCGRRGTRPLPRLFADWREFRVDIDRAAEPDLIADITDLSPIESNSVDAVLASHCVEHLYRHQVTVALSEFRRITRDDGFVCLFVPDLQTIANYITADRLDEPVYLSPAGPITAHDIVFGHGAALARGESGMAHRCGFTPTALAEQLKEARFTEFALRRLPSLELMVVARKTPWAEAADRQTLLDQLSA